MWSSAQAQPPAIRQNGVFNSATRFPSGLTSGSLARGSRFTVEGVRLSGPGAGPRMLLKHGNRTILLPIISAGSRRIDAWLPLDTPLGPAALTVEISSGASNPFPVIIVSLDPGLYTANEKGWGPAKVIRRSGGVIELSGTGFGATQSIKLMIGGRAVSASVTHGDSGLDSIRFRIPSDSAQGCFVPVYAVPDYHARSNVVSIGDTPGCAVPSGWPAPSERGRAGGIIGIFRSAVSTATDQPIVTNDEALAGFYASAWSADPSPMMLIPPPGLCTAYTMLYNSGGDFESIPAVLARLGGDSSLDAGAALTIETSNGARAVSRSGAHVGEYWALLGFDDPSRRRRMPLLLNEPQYRMTAIGGKAVGPFSEVVSGIPSFEWTNRQVLITIDRGLGIPITWSGMPRDAIVLIAAASFDSASTAGEVCYCAARPEAGAFEIPPDMLARFPATGTTPGPMRSGVMLAASRLRAVTGKTPSGLEVLREVSILAMMRRVVFE
jgi:uncharacterized protein (TIGR03437 family)